MLLQPPSRRRVSPSVFVSLLVHALVIAAVLGYAAGRRPMVIHPQQASSGTRVDLVYQPGRTAVSLSQPVHKPRPVLVAHPTPSSPGALPLLPAPLLPRVSPAPETASQSNATAPNPQQQTAGANLWGTGDAQQIALTTYSPSPAPDLSVLPRGVQGDVIVDITIGSDGRVSDLTVVKTLGYGVETAVVNTVRTWVFRPATKDGIPVASLQELLFHFSRPQLR